MLIHASRYNPTAEIFLSDICKYSNLSSSSPKCNPDEGMSVFVNDLSIIYYQGKPYYIMANDVLPDGVTKENSSSFNYKACLFCYSFGMTASALCFAETSKVTFDKDKFLKNFAPNNNYRIFKVENINLLVTHLGGEIIEMKYVNDLEKFSHFCEPSQYGIVPKRIRDEKTVIPLTDDALSYMAEVRIMVYGRKDFLYDNKEVLSQVFIPITESDIN